MNRLHDQKSPYLRQHAANPVDWYPWSDEALARARDTDTPLLISIGYATCHWCHVMAHECFEDNEVAELINRYFIPVKIDREELPHIDDYYMHAFQLLNGGGGGWPLTIFALPDTRPFLGATYIPKRDRGTSHGMMSLLPKIAALWREERGRVEESASAVGDYLNRPMGLLPDQQAGTSSAELFTRLADAAEAALVESYDREFGGFGVAPKFPAFHNLRFLLLRSVTEGNQELLDIVETTLRQIRASGSYDQLGFGVHRYATDRAWRVPHFEKMLYDQAGFLLLTAELFQVTGREQYRSMGVELFRYLQRELHSAGKAHPEAWYAAEDADSEGEEGKFYRWETEELKEVLSPDEFESLNRIFELPLLHAGENSPFLPTIAEKTREKLLEHRRKREPPFKDTKIMTDWNGFLIGALARGARAFQNHAMGSAAEEGIAWILTHLSEKSDGGRRLFHRYCDGEVSSNGFIDDYAYTIFALLELYQARFDPAHLRLAVEICDTLEAEFALPGGGYSIAATGSTDPGGTRRPLFDGAYPAGNSQMLHNLLDLFRITGEPRFEEALYRAAESLALGLSSSPAAGVHSAAAFDRIQSASREIVIAGRRGNPATEDALSELQRRYLPNTVLLFRDSGDTLLPELIPFTASMVPGESGPAFYLCREKVCARPLYSLARLAELL